MLVGYCRVSTTDQSPALQEDALKTAGCDRIFADVASGARSDRSGLADALSFVRAGDALVVWKLDRLGRSLRDLIERVTELHARGVGFRSLTESIDTTTSGGKLVFHIFGSLAEFERHLIRERTKAGLAAARARGRRGGRPRALSDRKLVAVKAMLDVPGTSVSAVCQEFRVSRTTLYRSLARARRSSAESAIETLSAATK